MAERYDDDYEDDDDRPRRSRRRYDDDYDYLTPHRGNLILTLGLVGLIGGFAFCLPFVVSPFAWIMGSSDLNAMRNGTMDPSGESLTRAGQVCGIIGTILTILYLALIVFIVLLVLQNPKAFQ